MANAVVYICGDTPDPMLTELVEKFGFASIQKYICYRLTTPSISTITDPRYIVFSYYT